MDTKEKHVKENEKRDNADLISESLPAGGRNRKNENTRKINRMWLWFGVLVLIAILLWWIFSMGLFEDMTGVTNG